MARIYLAPYILNNYYFIGCLYVFGSTKEVIVSQAKIICMTVNQDIFTGFLHNLILIWVDVYDLKCEIFQINQNWFFF